MALGENNLKLHFDVEVLTPIHVGGSGESHWQHGIDFISREGKTWVLDFEKLAQEVGYEKLSRQLVEGGSMKDLLKGEKLATVSWKSFPVEVSGPTEIKRHIFSGLTGNPYLPGSSIKGAVSSMLLSYFSKVTRVVERHKISEELLGSFGASVMRFFQTSDIPFSNTTLVPTKIFNLRKEDGKNWAAGWKHSRKETTAKFSSNGFVTNYECLSIGSRSNMSIIFKKMELDELLQNEKALKPPKNTHSWLNEFSAAKLCQLINNHTANFLRKEILFFQKYDIDDNTAILIKSLQDLKTRVETIDQSRECIFRLAAGSGFHSITGDWQHSDYINTGDTPAGKRKYKSRKVAFGVLGKFPFLPMGFISLRLLSEEDQKRAEEELLKRQILEKEETERQRKKEELDAEAARLAELEAKKPKFFEGKLKPGVELDAEIVVSGKPNKVKIFVKGQLNDQIPLVGYAASEAIGRVVVVTVNVVKKDGKVLDVRYKKFK